MKYWEYDDTQLIEKKMYPLLPLQLFNLRKNLEVARKKKDINRIKQLAHEAREIAEKIAIEAKELFDKKEILGDDFHKMLLAIQNLIEYLNRNYLEDKNIEEEVVTMTKTLIDPEVEKRGVIKGEYNKAIEIAKNLLDILDDETISKKTGVSIETVKQLRNS